MSPDNTNQINPDQQKVDEKKNAPQEVAGLQEVTQSQNFTSAPDVEKTEDPNWKAFREARKKDKQEKEAAERKAADKQAEVEALKAAMEAAFSKNQPQQHSNEGYDGYGGDETEDQKIERKVLETLQKRDQQAAREREERDRREMPKKLEAIYKDLNSTISDENLLYLEYHYPEIARPLSRLPDSFEKWEDIYKAIKKFVPNANQSQKESTKTDSNLSKPKSMSTTHVTHTGETGGSVILSEERKRANWERMQKTLRNVS